jgi:hypothetical protein
MAAGTAADSVLGAGVTMARVENRSGVGLFAVLLAIPLSGCSSEEQGPVTVTDEGNFLSFETEEFEVPPGDSFECFYTTTTTETELSVTGAKGSQGPGGHHIVVYYAEEARPVGHHPCSDAEMVNLHQIAGAGGEPGSESVLELREDLALKVPAGKQLVLQAHYINTTGAPYTVKDNVSLQLIDPAQVSEYVNYFVTLDETFAVPPQAEYTHVTHCEVPQDFDMVLTLGHMHEAGRRYTLEVIDEAENVMATLRDDAWEPAFTSHPPIDHYTMAQPLELTAGTVLRQTCTWHNDTAETMLFPREMCLSFMYYFPAAGDQTAYCYEP